MKLLNSLLVLALTASICFGAGWRTDGHGYYPDAKPPTTWSAEDNVAWKVKLPQWSNASPVISGDKVIACADPSTILCLSKSDGSILWQESYEFESFLSEEDRAKARELAPKVKSLEEKTGKLNKQLRELRKIKDEAERKEKEAPIRKELEPLKKELDEAAKYSPPKTHGAMGYSTPTPACDGKSVVVMFGNGIAACHSIDGTKKWAKMIGRPTHKWGHSTSPVIVGQKVIFQVTDVIALDLETGTEAWRVPGKQAFGSVVHAKIDGKDLIVTSEGKVIAAEDGKVLAQDLVKLEYCSPVVVDDVAYFIQAGGKAFRLSGEEGSKPEELWKTEPKKDRYYGSPIIHEGLIYAVTRAGDMSVIDARDGKVLNSTKLKSKGTHYTSPTFAGGYVFVGTEGGDIAVLKAGKELEEVSLNKLEKLRSCPVFEGTRMYLRGLDHLYCIEQQD